MHSEEFVLIHSMDGILEVSDEDIFDEKYVVHNHKGGGIYKVMHRRDWGDYRTSRKVRTIEIRAYAAEDEEPQSEVIKEKLKEFDEKKSDSVGVEKKEEGYRLVRKKDGDTLQILAADGNVVLDDFTFEQLRDAKTAYDGSEEVTRKDLHNQDFLKFVAVFLGGLVLGALGVYLFMQRKHNEELAGLNMQIQALSEQIKQMSAPRKSTNPDMWFVSEYNESSGGPKW